MTTPHTEADILIAKDLTIEGINQQQTIVQAAEQARSGSGRVFTILSGNSVTFRDFTIQHGDAWPADGGGVWIQASSGTSLVTMERISIKSNYAADGGGVFNEARLVMRDFLFDDNEAGFNGGGIKNTDELQLLTGRISNNEGGGIDNSDFVNGQPTLFVEAVDIIGNNAPAGGGISNFGAMTITGGSVIESNWASSSGGGIVSGGEALVLIENSIIARNNIQAFSGNDEVEGAGIRTLGPMKITDTEIRSNGAGVSVGKINGGGLSASNTEVTLARVHIAFNESDRGGGVYSSGSSVNIEDSSVYSNEASSGGGISIQNGAVTIENSTIEANEAQLSGGGVYQCFGELELSHVTIANNIANILIPDFGDAGGLFVCSDATTEIRNSIIAENRVMGDGLYPDCNARMTGSFSLIGDTGPSTGNRCGVDGVFQAGMIYNVVVTIFDAPVDQGHRRSIPLLPNSVAIDAAGCSDADGGVLEFDQRGAPMPVDGDGDGDAECDMGAAEFGSGPVRPDPLFLDGFE